MGVDPDFQDLLTGASIGKRPRKVKIEAIRKNFSFGIDAIIWHHSTMTRKHRKTLESIFAHPPSAKVKWRDIEALFRGEFVGLNGGADFYSTSRHRCAKRYGMVPKE